MQTGMRYMFSNVFSVSTYIISGLIVVLLWKSGFILYINKPFHLMHWKQQMFLWHQNLKHEVTWQVKPIMLLGIAAVRLMGTGFKRTVLFTAPVLRIFIHTLPDLLNSWPEKSRIKPSSVKRTLDYVELSLYKSLWTSLNFRNDNILDQMF